MKPALIFDVDGTIIPLLVDFDSLRGKIKKLLGISEDLRPLGLSLERLNIKQELKARAWEIIEAEEIDSISELTIEDYKENVDLICSLHDSGYNIVIVTNRSRHSLELLLEKTGMKKCIDKVITREFSLDRRKQLEEALKSIDGDCIGFLGDTVYDEAAAKELGVEFRRVFSHKDLPKHVKELINSSRMG